MADINKIHVITKTIFVVMPPHTLWNVYEYSVHQSAKLKKIMKLAAILGFLKPGFARDRVSPS